MITVDTKSNSPTLPLYRWNLSRPPELAWRCPSWTASPCRSQGCWTSWNCPTSHVATRDQVQFGQIQAIGRLCSWLTSNIYLNLSESMSSWRDPASECFQGAACSTTLSKLSLPILFPRVLQRCWNSGWVLADVEVWRVLMCCGSLQGVTMPQKTRIKKSKRSVINKSPIPRATGNMCKCA